MTSLANTDRVLEAWLSITTPYSGGATITLGQAGATAIFQATTDNNPQVAGDYIVPQDTLANAAGAVRATVGGAPGAGAATVIIKYSTPNP